MPASSHVAQVSVFLLLLFSHRVMAAQWGTFRPHTLMSLRAAVPHSPYFGFLYHPAHSMQVRHLTTEAHHHIPIVSYSRHDPVSFADQTIVDTDANLRITTSFLNHPSHADAVALRLSAVLLNASRASRSISLVFYAVAAPEEIPTELEAADPPWGSLHMAPQSFHNVRFEGTSPAIGGRYTIRLSPCISTPSHIETESSAPISSRARRRTRREKVYEMAENMDESYISSIPSSLTTAWAVDEHLKKLLHDSENEISFPEFRIPLLDAPLLPSAPGVLVQRIVQPPFVTEASFVLRETRSEKIVSAIEADLTATSLDLHLEKARKRFDDKFQRLFSLREKNVPQKERIFAKEALANLLGGIGFFYGSSVVKNDKRSTHSKSTSFLPPVALFTATPSRATFPRGFLWDEGFHQLTVQRWNPDISRQCLDAWLRATQQNGWIPREQVLGLEARSRFPQHVKHLMIQNPLIANPPTILLPLRVFAALSLASESQHTDVTKKHFVTTLDRVAKYYAWLKNTQSGHLENSFRWRGRSLSIKSPDGYPLTLASGLDDYPRAFTPSKFERHVDLHCWMVWASGTLAQISEEAGVDATNFRKEHDVLKASLLDMHGSNFTSKSHREDLLLCDYSGEERICHEGYITILPLALGILQPNDVRVSAILDSLEDPLLLRARAGVRSLSKSDQWYRKGDDYWTGSVWMPFNFLTLAALKTKYSVEEGPYRARALKIYKDLRKSILDNAFRIYSETGQLWENYSPDDDGAGKSGRQFTGWTSLVLLIYADMFEGVA